jgi:phycocyanobilin:ferredoxin oxidoreductase
MDIKSLSVNNSLPLKKSLHPKSFHHREFIVNGMYENDYIKTKTFLESLESSVDHEIFSATVLGLGLWRLRPIIRRKMAIIIARLEGIVRQCCLEDGLDVVSPGEFDYLDNLDPNGEKDALNPYFASDTPNPRKNDVEYPRFQIENRVYKSRVFRKIHFEIAARQDGLQVFHLVMYPRFQYDLPIMCLDLVGYSNGSMFAIADTSPVRLDKSLPEFYTCGVKLLLRDFPVFQNSLPLPNWGRKILSRFCVCVKPSSAEEINTFSQYIFSLVRIHLEVSRLIDPLEAIETKKTQEIIACHRRFCHNQIKNKKTYNTLAMSFGEYKAGRYIRDFMFNCP